MVQLSNLFNSLSKNISSKNGKKGRVGIGREAANNLAKEAKRKELLMTSSGGVNAGKGQTSATGYSKRGKKGLNNQDCFIMWEEFGGQEDMDFCGVFDGHGAWGHYVSKTVREIMPPLLLSNWQEALELNGHENQIHSDLWEQTFCKTCAEVDQELQHYPGIDSFYSGTTALALVRQGNLMIVANVGDSRAVLATTSDDGTLAATQLTTDFKPSLPNERERIKQSTGTIYSCPDEPRVHRLWLPKGGGPGLAVSRAFGDYYIKDFGLISLPEVTQRSITKRDQFVILATDGVWDVISNEQAVEIVGSSERGESAKRLVECAVCAWKQRGKSAVMDDISVVCFFFHGQLSPQNTMNDNKKHVY